MDEFYIGFDKMVNETFPKYRNKIQLFYITTANEKSIRKQLEDGLAKVLNEIT
ncbi:hypothetical protein ABIB50_005176 [Mucilaginibacter sp. UYCu711]